MTRTMLILEDAYGDKVRVSLDSIQGYRAYQADMTEVYFPNVSTIFKISVEQLDAILIECLFMVKKVH